MNVKMDVKTMNGIKARNKINLRSGSEEEDGEGDGDFLRADGHNTRETNLG